MNKPRIELYGPERRGDYWAAAVRVHFADGSLDIVARANSKLAARALAKLHGAVAIRAQRAMPKERFFVGADPDPDASTVGKSGGGKPWARAKKKYRAAMRRVIDAQAARPRDPDEIKRAMRAQLKAFRVMNKYAPRSSVWEDIGEGIAAVTRTPAFKAAIRVASAAIPYVGPVIAATGVTDLAIDAAGAAVDKATGKGKGRAPARQRIADVGTQAKAGNPAAVTAHRVLLAAAKTQKNAGPKGLVAFRGIGRAAVLVKRAKRGDEGAEDRIAELVELAQDGNERAIEAVAYLEAARVALEETAGLRYELDELDEDDLDEVGAAQSAALSDRELVARLTLYRNWKRGQRRKVAA